MTTQDAINLTETAVTPEQIREANALVPSLLCTSLDPAEAESLRKAKADARNTMLDGHEVEQQQALRFLALNGTQYDLNEWLTPVEYARRYGLRSANNVTNWMMRGIIPPVDIVDMPELNGLKLVRDRVYKVINPQVSK